MSIYKEILKNLKWRSGKIKKFKLCATILNTQTEYGCYYREAN